MNQVVLLLNPTQLPNNLFAKSLTWAKEHQSTFKVIVITDEKFNVEQVTTRPDDSLEPISVENNRFNVIIRQIKNIRQEVIRAGLNFSSHILVQPRITDVLNEIRFAEMIFFEFVDEPAGPSFDWHELFHNIPMRKKVISNKVHG